MFTNIGKYIESMIVYNHKLCQTSQKRCYSYCERLRQKFNSNLSLFSETMWLNLIHYI